MKNPWNAKVPEDIIAPGSDVILSGTIAPADAPTAVDRSHRAEQARVRFTRLNQSFADLMELISEMYQQEDWKYLTREDGSEYRSLAEVVAESLSISSAMARRYVQGVKALYLPLSGVAIEGTVISIESSDVRDLGMAGAKEVLDLAEERLEGVDDPEEAGQIIKDTIKEVRQKPDPNSSEKDESGSFYDDDGVVFDEDVMAGKSACGILDEGGVDPCYLTVGHNGRCSWDEPDDELGPPVALPVTMNEIDDPISTIIASGKNYLDADERQLLPEQLREVVDALAVIAAVDPARFALLVKFETRGVAQLLPVVSQNAVRMQAIIESQPWLLSRLV